ncbi:MAG: hypothetical protein FWD57_06540 [Polyangiaceae bacterium]|nr:hypothetical protein [Polyangiaceae bacterium]
MIKTTLTSAIVASSIVLEACSINTEEPENTNSTLDNPQILTSENTTTCINDDDCSNHCSLIQLSASTTPPPPTFSESLCELALIIASDEQPQTPAPACLCFQDSPTNNAIILSNTSPDPCLLYGQNRNCLYEKSEFPSCNTNQPTTSCNDICNDIERRLLEDSLKPASVTLRHTQCASTGCHCILQINDSCFVDDWLDPYSCNLDNDTIISTFETQLLNRDR